MKADVKKRLDRLIFMQRLKYTLVATGVAIAVLGFLFFVGYEQTIRMDKVVATTNIDGTITQIKPGSGRKGGFRLKVSLDDGRSVGAVSFLPGFPFKGERLTLNEIIHKSGKKDFIVTRYEAPHE